MLFLEVLKVYYSIEMDEELKNSVLKTGTSILGIVCKDGIVMAGDRQVTGGQSIIMDKNYQKLFKINTYLVASYTGGVSDAQLLNKIVAAELRLKELRSKSRPSIKEAANLFAMLTFRNIRQFSTIISIVGTLIGGLDENGETKLFSVDPAGGIYEVKEYDASFGSGMPYILGLMERSYKKDITVKEGVNLAIEALKSSTQRDTGSGFGIDVFTITKEGINHVVRQKIEPLYREEKK
ncbi:proteasome subunit beta [Candidatus Pacearchaeota archaeon]|nr:proteasome subunit beta [Candidatus Pacearchaeota archaeon]